MAYTANVSVFLTTVADDFFNHHHRDFVECWQQALDQATTPPFVKTIDPSTADLIVFLEPNSFKDHRYLRSICSNRLLKEFSDKCFCIDYHNNPQGFLPGAYTSMNRASLDPNRHCAIGYPNTCYNEHLEAFANERDTEMKFLLSFRGSASHPLRRKLFESTTLAKLGPITEIRDRWFDHTESEKESYCREILESKFVLCPRGIATSSVRMYEVMQLGRVPVVLSDDWVRPPGPDWQSAVVFSPESDVNQLADRLIEFEHRFEAMSKNARTVWNEWFSPKMRFSRILQSLYALKQSRPSNHDERSLQSIWSSHAFKKQHGFLLSQRIARKMRRMTN